MPHLQQRAEAASAADSSEPFDFLVDGQLLRTSLQSLLEARKLSTVRLQLWSPAPASARDS